MQLPPPILLPFNYILFVLLCKTKKYLFKNVLLCIAFCVMVIIDNIKGNKKSPGSNMLTKTISQIVL